MLNWDDWRVFLGVARTGSLSATARQLGVDQSTITRRLATLQSNAGSRLFERTPSGYALTVVGEAVREHAEEIESRALCIERKLSGADTRPEGTVRLAASDSFAVWLLVRELTAFRLAFPGIQLGLVTGNRAVSLARREADVALRLSKPSEPQLLARRLGLAAWALYATPDYLKRKGPLRLREQLASHDVIGFDPELRGTVGARWLAQHAGQARVALSTNSLLTQAEAVVAGLGLCPLPCLFGDREPSLVRAQPRVLGHHEIWLVLHPDVKASARVRALCDHLIGVVTAQADLLAGKLNARRPRRPVSRRASLSRAAR